MFLKGIVTAFLILVSTTVFAESIDTQLKCLAENIYYEAGQEDFSGKVAVAQVTINRTETIQFPSTICGVVQQRTRIGSQIFCQFSWNCNKSHKIDTSSYAWKDSLNIAEQVMFNGLRLDGMEQALYFHNTVIKPNWNLERISKIGNHIFYGNKRKHNK